MDAALKAAATLKKSIGNLRLVVNSVSMATNRNGGKKKPPGGK